MRFRLIGAALVAIVALALGGAASASDASTVVVRSGDLHGWQIIPDGTVPFDFVLGSHSIGVGSLQFGPITNAGESDPPPKPGRNKFIMVSPYTGLASDLTSFSYDFYIAQPNPAGTQYKQFYVNVYVDRPENGFGTTFYDCRYDLVPTSGSAGDWLTGSFTQTSAWTAVVKYPFFSGTCPTTLGGLPQNSRVLAIALNGGDSSTSDYGLAGGFDNVVVATSGATMTYDFEPGLLTLKQSVATSLALLFGMSTTPKKDKEHIGKALDHLNNSINGDWTDPSHLGSQGKKVFDEERKALEELDKVKGTDVSGLAGQLVSVDRNLAQIAIDDATAANGDSKELAKAQDEMDKGDKAKNDQEAVDHYKHAWEHAMKAANKPVDDGGDSPAT